MSESVEVLNCTDSFAAQFNLRTDQYNARDQLDNALSRILQTKPTSPKTKTKAPACKVIDSKPRLEITYQRFVNGSMWKIDLKNGLAEKLEYRSPKTKVPINK